MTWVVKEKMSGSWGHERASQEWAVFRGIRVYLDPNPRVSILKGSTFKDFLGGL